MIESREGVRAETSTNYYFGGKLIKNAGGYVYADRLGSIGKYYPYGQERPSATQNGKEKFATYFRDAETGLDYADQRYHSPGTGRFMSPDRYRASGGAANPGSWNRYAYVEGDPINAYDPGGMIKQCTPDTHTAPSGFGCDPNPITFDPPPRIELCAMNPEACLLGPPHGLQPELPPPSPYLVYKIVDGTDSQKHLVKDAVAAAMWRVANNDDCFRFFGSKGYDLLYNTEYDLFSFGPDRNGIAAQEDSSIRIFINTTGAFFDDALVAAKAKELGTSTNDFLEFLILHELGHQAGVLLSEGTQAHP